MFLINLILNYFTIIVTRISGSNKHFKSKIKIPITIKKQYAFLKFMLLELQLHEGPKFLMFLLRFKAIAAIIINEHKTIKSHGKIIKTTFIMPAKPYNTIKTVISNPIKYPLTINAKYVKILKMGLKFKNIITQQ